MGSVNRSVDPLDRFASMHRMRAFEEAVGAGVASGEIHGEMHLGLGQEAIAAGIEPFLRRTDALVSTHRPHLHALAHGVDPVRLLAELFERDGMSAGKGGHMHLFDADRPFMCTGIVGAQPPIALGYALAAARRGEGEIAVAAVGDGAVATGAFAESLNLAALWHLPLLMLIEDNGYGISVPKALALAGELAHRGAPFDIPGFACDGTDVQAVIATADEAFAVARALKPVIVVATCYRYSGHYEGDPDHYRSKSEKDAAMAPDRDPIARQHARLLADGHTEEELTAIATEARGTVNRWTQEAKTYPWPALDTAIQGAFV